MGVVLPAPFICDTVRVGSTAVRDNATRKADLRVLVVDDEPEITAMLARALARHGFSVDTTNSGRRAIELMRADPYDAAIVDLVMPDGDGMELSVELRAIAPALPIALLTAFQNSPLLAAAERWRVVVFHKPVEVFEIVVFLQSELGIQSA